MYGRLKIIFNNDYMQLAICQSFNLCSVDRILDKFSLAKQLATTAFQQPYKVRVTVWKTSTNSQQFIKVFPIKFFSLTVSPTGLQSIYQNFTCQNFMYIARPYSLKISLSNYCTSYMVHIFHLQLDQQVAGQLHGKLCTWPSRSTLS